MQILTIPKESGRSSPTGACQYQRRALIGSVASVTHSSTVTDTRWMAMPIQAIGPRPRLLCWGASFPLKHPKETNTNGHGLCTVGSHVCKLFPIGKIIEIKSKLAVAGVWLGIWSQKRGMTTNGCGNSFQAGENFSKEGVVMVAHLCEYTQDH